ncbi:NADH-quinone oxidoreductase subunit J [Formivibrio citricus]|uniref:NADH-quinone oxidoreductase subunit J n=1 Tax=Formivibrio citricus TaxID=83765 RepID=A0A1I4WZ06_9NEIS|nr:NADH-quinone oxidoreductase subunit J [Formivibrio citricus]SFN18219.1 NADH-quinone oxidoreductase subunit J [Formivibrio citricus]
MTLALFYLFAAILVLAALRVVTARNPVHAALSLVLCFFTAAMLWMLIKAEFLAISLVLIYVGAVMVLFLFVVMMLDINFESLRKGFWRFFPVAGTVAAIMLGEMLLVLTSRYANLSAARLPEPAAGFNSAKALGKLLYTEYFLPFQLAAVLLLVGMIAAIALTHRQRKNTKFQDPADQVAVKAADRVVVLKMEAEKPAHAETDTTHTGEKA